MRQIRVGVFETNSSSTHSLTMCSKEVFDQWKSGTKLFDRYGRKFVDADNIPSGVDEDDLKTHDEFMTGDYLETFVETHTTPSGEEVVAFGEYGYDG